MTTEQIHDGVNGALTELLQLIADVNEEEFNMVPFEGSWTVGQVAQHMTLAHTGFIGIVHGPVKKTERDPDVLIEKFRNDFLNFDVKMKSPAFAMPPNSVYDKSELLGGLEVIRKNALNAIDTLDLAMTCTAFELPRYGFMTRLEAMHFVQFHTLRHNYQLKNIREKLSEADKSQLRAIAEV